MQIRSNHPIDCQADRGGGIDKVNDTINACWNRPKEAFTGRVMLTRQGKNP